MQDYLDLNETRAKNLDRIHRITYKWVALDNLMVYNLLFPVYVSRETTDTDAFILSCVSGSSE